MLTPGISMKEMSTILKDLIAPCGMNCAICSKYLVYVNKLKRSQCAGCRTGQGTCAYLFAKCTGENKDSTCNRVFCFECRKYPCSEIQRMDKRYKKNHRMSVVDNLTTIKKRGIDTFIKEQYEKYHCSECNGLISIHNGKCFKCDTITKLVDRNNCGHH